MDLKVINREGKIISLIDDDAYCGDNEVAKVYTDNWSSRLPLTEEKGMEYILKIKRDMEKNNLHISVGREKVTIYRGIVGIASIYWSEDDDWEYGILTKDEAVEIAEHLMKLFKMDTLPHSKPHPFIVFRGRYEVVDSIDTLGSFKEVEDAKFFVSNVLDKKPLIRNDINEHGIRSYASCWANSVRFHSDSEFSSDEIKKYSLLILDYIDKSWCR